MRIKLLVEGEINKTKAEWGYCKLWGDFIPEQVETKGYVKAEHVDEMEVYENGTYVSDVLNRGFFYTMYLHRGVNENCKMHRTILSIALQENIDIHAVHKVYEQGKLLNESKNRTVYYFEVNLRWSKYPFDVQQYFVSEQQRHEAQDDVKTQDKVEQGESRSLSANW